MKLGLAFEDESPEPDAAALSPVASAGLAGGLDGSSSDSSEPARVCARKDMRCRTMGDRPEPSRLSRSERRCSSLRALMSGSSPLTLPPASLAAVLLFADHCAAAAAAVARSNALEYDASRDGIGTCT